MRYLGSPSSQAEIAAIFAARRYELKISTRALDDLAGCPDGWCAKTECGVKAIGSGSFQNIAGALGVRWLVVEGRLFLWADDSAIPPLTRRFIGTCKSRPGHPNPRRKAPRPLLSVAA